MNKQLLIQLYLLLPLLILTSCGPDQHPAQAYEIKGIDVSRYQADIDWQQVSATGIDFAFVKATEGGDHVDEQFTTNWQALAQSGIRRGPYHFYRPNIPPKEQANNFFALVGELAVGDLPPVLDIEVRGKQGKTQFITDLKEWLLLAEAKYGAKPILYTGQKFYNRYLAGHFADYPIWIARYNQDAPSLADGRSFQFWQYSDAGKLPGITGPVDFNIFTGTHLDLALLSIPLREQVDVTTPVAIR